MGMTFHERVRWQSTSVAAILYRALQRHLQRRIGSGKDGLPIILGNVDTPAPAGSTPPSGNDKSTTAAGPTTPLEKTPAAGLATPTEKIPPPPSSGTPAAATSEGSRSFYLSDIETYLTQMLLPTERKTEPRSRQPSQ
jgi:hypothetical protein